MTAMHIGISHPPDLPSGLLDDFASAIRHPKLILLQEERPRPGPFAGLEWLMPTAVIVYITKPYFESFLGEAGRDHYQLLKKSLAKLSSRFTGAGAPVTRLFFSDGKVKTPEPKYSLTYSVVGEIGDGLSAKLLLQATFTADQCNEALISFLHFLDSLHNGTLDVASVIGLSDAKPVGRTLLLAYDAESKSLVVVDPRAKT
jgi:hypothetical protein